MGYSYDVATGALVCDECGRHGSVRKRRCPSGYCPPVALCATCNAFERTSGAWWRHHAECAERHAEIVAREAQRAAEPHLWARSASMTTSWEPEIPEGMVRVTTYAGTTVLVPQGDYDSRIRGFGYTRKD